MYINNEHTVTKKYNFKTHIVFRLRKITKTIQPYNRRQ